MIKRCDEKENCYFISLPYENIPNDYIIKSCTGNQFDLSYVNIMAMLTNEYKNEKFTSQYEKGIEFQDKKFICEEILEKQSNDFYYAATLLRDRLNAERDGNTVSYYTAPCAFCCKQSIELYLKFCMSVANIEFIKEHSLTKLWEKFKDKEIPQRSSIETFLKEMDSIDKNGTLLRYGLDKKLNIENEGIYCFNTDVMLLNAGCVINILYENVVLKNRYKNDINVRGESK